MDISQLQSPGQLSSPAGEQIKPQISSDFETFLKMMTAQIENQDPLDPIDSADYAVQLATFSSVEQQVKTNDLLSALGGQLQLSGMAEMAAWVGMDARAVAPGYFDGSPITIWPKPAAGSDNVELVVSDEAGNEVYRSSIPNAAEPIEWAGVMSDGYPVASGLYSFEIASYSNDEVVLSESPEIYSQVSDVRSEGGLTVLVLEGGTLVPTASVTGLKNPNT